MSKDGLLENDLRPPVLTKVKQASPKCNISEAFNIAHHILRATITDGFVKFIICLKI